MLRGKIYLSRQQNAIDYYLNGNEDVLPRNIASRQAFLNALTVDVSIGGSTNTILHMLAIANEAGVDLDMKDIDQLSRITPNLCKLSPNAEYYMEDVNRAGGIVAIMSELNKGGLLDNNVLRVDRLSLPDLFSRYDILSEACNEDFAGIYYSAPAGKTPYSFEFLSHQTRFAELDKEPGKNLQKWTAEESDFFKDAIDVVMRGEKTYFTLAFHGGKWSNLISATQKRSIYSIENTITENISKTLK